MSFVRQGCWWQVGQQRLLPHGDSRNVKAAESCSDVLMRTVQAPAQPSVVVLDSVEGTRSLSLLAADLPWPGALEPWSSQMTVHPRSWTSYPMQQHVMHTRERPALKLWF